MDKILDIRYYREYAKTLNARYYVSFLRSTSSKPRLTCVIMFACIFNKAKLILSYAVNLV